jgi:hypothetical protein
VLVDGEKRGVTPLTLRELTLGRHTVEVSRSGYAPAERQVSLTRARPTAAISVSLKRAGASAPAAGPSGSLAVDSLPPGARVFLDGRLVGTTPVVVDRITPGSHVVRLERTGYRRWSTSVDIVAGARSKLTGALELEQKQ